MDNLSLRRPVLMLLTVILVAQASLSPAWSAPLAQGEQPPVLLGACPPPAVSAGIAISYDPTLDLGSDFLSGLFSLASSYVRRGTFHAGQREYVQARAYYTYAIENLTYLYNIFNGRAFEKARTGQTREAVADYVRAYALSVNLADIRDRRGLTNVALGNYEEAVEDITQALAFVPQLRVNPAYSAAYYETGNRLDDRGQFRDAVVMYTRAIALRPNYVEAFHNRAGAYDRLELYPQAVADYSCSIQLDADYAANYHLRGRAYAGMGDYALAIEDYSRALNLNPRLALAYIDRGLAYRALNNYVQAITDYTWAILANPNEASAYNNRGIAYAEIGLYNDALRDYNRAIQLNPTNPNYYNNRAWAQIALGNESAGQLDFARMLASIDYTVPRVLIEIYGETILQPQSRG